MYLYIRYVCICSVQNVFFYTDFPFSQYVDKKKHNRTLWELKLMLATRRRMSSKHFLLRLIVRSLKPTMRRRESATWFASLKLALIFSLIGVFCNRFWVTKQCLYINIQPRLNTYRMYAYINFSRHKSPANLCSFCISSCFQFQCGAVHQMRFFFFGIAVRRSLF